MLSDERLEKLTAGRLSLHRHERAYVAIIRRGRYTEAAIDGRFKLRPGMVVVHPRFHLHSNVVDEETSVWNVDLGAADAGGWRAVRSAATERLAARVGAPRLPDIWEAMETAEDIALEPAPKWIKDLSMLDDACFSDVRRNVGREHAHRTFARYFGMPPGRFRRERRLQRAIGLMTSRMDLATIAVETGFADQSHMTRLFKRELGVTPARFRKTVTPVQDEAVDGL
ncbi:MAG: helix-turn-helix domain-containing protein [Pseudomonadota bacterium]